MNFYLEKGVPPLAWRWGGTGIDVKIWIKPKESSSKAFFHTILKFFTRVEGGIGGPNTPAGALGSPVKTSPNLLAEKSNINTRAGFTITFAWIVRAVAHFNDF